MTAVVVLEIAENGADAARLDLLSRRLLRDLRDLGLDAERLAVAPPAGAKSGTSGAVTSLVVGLAGTQALVAMINGLFGWLGPRRGNVKISCGDRSIELSAATPAEGQRLFEWLQTCDRQNPETDAERPGA
ncbi:hypothetical protein E1200_29885 [Actinomadura sp. GC306]|uniref:effector-associated constant component EACC1 n=1 Tax=Actinomadura sp. GC306 TaxID=2530367 RepID=UPI001050746A|nr:hypothetical protein [Actinomadura sp. GC306]TDC60801.1 hypothetical protein E1200_29885 [Actinomadura sp. GC306]